MRLHRYLALCGVASRRKSEELILEGRVEVNGEVIIELGAKASANDDIRVDGRPVHLPKLVTLAMYKPTGVITTMDDPQRRNTVAGLLPDVGVAVKPIGRLDQDTDGLLLFTNDGDLAARLTHPRWGVEKEYIAKVSGHPSEHDLDRLRRGVWIEGGRTAPAQVEVLGEDHETTTIRIVVHEGRKRQIRFMCEAIGKPVQTLRRVRFGSILLKGMTAGECRILGMVEVDRLRAAVGLTKAPSAPRKPDTRPTAKAGGPKPRQGRPRRDR